MVPKFTQLGEFCFSYVLKLGFAAASAPASGSQHAGRQVGNRQTVCIFGTALDWFRSNLYVGTFMASWGAGF